MRPEITLIAHNIRSTHNVGAIFRTAEGFGVKQIILSGYTPYPYFDGDKRIPHLSQKISQQIHKTALGAERMVPFDYYPELDDWLKLNSTNAQLPLIALEQSADSIPIADYQAPDKLALLLGEEVSGIEPKYLDAAKTILEIPMHGQKESFNVSVATGIALYALTQSAT